ncbi:uncharacterized protein LOC127368849 isoform X3 [Dicentrarchus labrax]|uniref:uncharacterized protein LOC127368849 isoform X3 n=2 Tax=Dicentrarchus labrax TaxID=13489 RepID=UPI0021F64043|nr:uncharacterized protein LOC127368849 isoform X3 [Dicentrarchus labrax]
MDSDVQTAAVPEKETVGLCLLSTSSCLKCTMMDDDEELERARRAYHPPNNWHSVLPTMAKYITHLELSLDAAEEPTFRSKGFQKNNVDLNNGAGGKSIHLWYKKESGAEPITRIQCAFNRKMEDGLIDAGYQKVVDWFILWYFQGQTEYDIPIVDIDVTTDDDSAARKFTLGWERLSLDLGLFGTRFHFWLKREKPTYICDVSATETNTSDGRYFKEGFIRIDDDINKSAGGSDVFTWYRQTTDPQRALSDLNVSTNDLEYQVLQRQNYHRVSVNLNEGTGGNQVYLWYKKQAGNDRIKGLLLIPDVVEGYRKAGVIVIERNLNAGNKGPTEYLCFYQ